MQAKKRYILVFVSCAFLAYAYFGGYRLKVSPLRPRRAQHESAKDGGVQPPYEQLPSFLDQADPLGPLGHLNGSAGALGALGHNDSRRSRGSECRMETCFDFTRCYEQFLVYVYPPEPLNSLGAASPTSATTRRYSLPYRSRATTPAIPRPPASLCSAWTPWTGTPSPRTMCAMSRPGWPACRTGTTAGITSSSICIRAPGRTMRKIRSASMLGHAILAKASMSVLQVRHGFDVSIPLFHKQFPLRAGATGSVQSNNFPANKKYLLAFKGKRYVHGIGSETRNSLFHLHNGRDMVLVTTCRHGKSWRELQDNRCDEDNREYDRYDYETLLQNSTFCLVPRGRRLGSFRFLEALQAGCIPVLLSNAWVLPFESKIDWKQAAIWADERLLLQVPDIVRSISAERIFALRQQTQVLWERYFGSIEKIVFTTFEIIRERLPDYPVRSSLVWNSSPGALLTLPTFADSSRFMPFMLNSMGAEPRHNYTAVIYVQIGAAMGPNAALYKLVKTITKSQFVDRILVLWAAERPLPLKKRWPPTYHIPLHVVALGGNTRIGAGAGPTGQTTEERPSISQRFVPYDEIQTDAVLSLDEDAILNTDELDFAYTVWRDFPERIVGYPARAHFWDDSKNAWGYTSKWTNYYSIVLTGAAFYHRYYNYWWAMWYIIKLHPTNFCLILHQLP
ncbi:GL11446 [Drosophila persimilis]|uniref:GL11446 n=1 Tax=Drosophila persimilis TaxID=7234 RepID=B4GAV2_DROPE|nr:GL11446 [Drosophila persimilis]